MSVRDRPWTSGLVALVLLLTALPAIPQLPDGPIKNIRGVVRSLRGQPIEDAIVFIVNTTTNVTRTMRTNAEGLYRLNGLPAEGDYEVSVQFEGQTSEVRVVSSFLARTDNIVNFSIEVVSVGDEGDDRSAVSFTTFDLVEIWGSFHMPEGVQAPIPAALLLHGYGESRGVWSALREDLLANGWAVLAIDLRGHGDSLTRNRDPLTLDVAWRRDSTQFPLDLDPALDFLKTRPRLNSSRIAVIGFELGANLALSASGRRPEVGTVVAMSPDIDEAMSLAGAAQDFMPHTALLMVNDVDAGTEARTYINGASRITSVSVSGGTPNWLAASNTIDEIMRWLRDSF